jgi:type I restriction enzyme S subunit
MKALELASRRLRDVVTLEKGKPPAQQPYFLADAERYLTPDYLRGGHSVEFVKAGARAVRVSDGDTIVLWDGSNAGEVMRGRAGVLASTMTRASHGSEFDRGYFFYALKRWESFLKGQTSGSGIPHVDNEILGNLSIIQFEQPEQTKIAEILRTVDLAIDQAKTLIAKHQRIKTGLMQDLLTRGIDEHGELRSEHTHEFKDSPLRKIPVEWDTKRLNQMTRADSAITYGVVQPGRNAVSGVRFVRGGDIYEGEIRQEQLRTISPAISANYKRTVLEGGEIVMSLVGYPGEVAVVPPDLVGGNIARQVALMRLSAGYDPRFVMYYLMSALGKGQVVGASLGSAQQVINLRDLKSVTVPRPTECEQVVIRTRIEAAVTSLNTNLLRLEKLRLLKTGLMQDLLTGRRRVTNLLHVPLRFET